MKKFSPQAYRHNRLFMVAFIMLVVQLMGFAAQLRQHPNTHFYESGELSSDLITCITQDRQGYTWIATEYGLNRFDGIRFVHYFHSDSDSLSIGSDHVGSLLVDRNGNLWTACYERLQRYDAQTNNFVWAFTPDTIHGFNDLRQEKDGRILANSNRGVVDRPLLRFRGV